MGCTASTPVVEEAPPEPVPSYAEFTQSKVIAKPGEPQLTEKENNHTVDDEPLLLIVRQVGASNKGDSFQVETMEDALFHELQIHPAKPGIGVKKRLEDLVVLHRENQQDPIAYAIKNVSVGLEHYLILKPTPRSSNQKPVKFESPFGPMYLFALVEFNVRSKIVSVRLAGQSKDQEPLYTVRQCNPKVWVLKKQQEYCAGIQQVQGMLSFRCFRLVVRPGVDPVLISLLTHCVDSFLATAKTQGWKLYPASAGNNTQTIDFPPLEDGMEERLFGRKVRWWGFGGS